LAVSFRPHWDSKRNEHQDVGRQSHHLHVPTGNITACPVRTFLGRIFAEDKFVRNIFVKNCLSISVGDTKSLTDGRAVPVMWHRLTDSSTRFLSVRQ